MRIYPILKLFLALSFMGSLGSSTFVHSSPKSICFRFSDQWKVGEKDRKQLQQKYKIVCLVFDKHGTIVMKGLAPATRARFVNLYNQCMRDGCLFCDADEGSCEEGTCGRNNAFCKPYMENDLPLCGEECGYYALHNL